ncbi:MAG: 4Fe-4S cluster-binding domain-containing protein [bacterium]
MNNQNNIARLIITFTCNRACQGCCNSYSSILNRAEYIDDVSEISGFNSICLTGGEPLLNIDSTINILQAVKIKCPNSKVYLYTAFFTERVNEILDMVDGIHYTLHAEANLKDIEDFEKFQSLISIRSNEKSFRLYIDSRVKHAVSIKPNIWKRLEIKRWLTEEELLLLQPEGLPPNEKLFILKEKE